MTKRKAINLSTKGKKELTRTSNRKTETAATVLRAEGTLFYNECKRIIKIAIKMNTNRPMFERIINLALILSPLKALISSTQRKAPITTDDVKSWVLSIVCPKSLDFDCTRGT